MVLVLKHAIVFTFVLVNSVISEILKHCCSSQNDKTYKIIIITLCTDKRVLTSGLFFILSPGLGYLGLGCHTLILLPGIPCIYIHVTGSAEKLQCAQSKIYYLQMTNIPLKIEQIQAFSYGRQYINTGMQHFAWQLLN